MRALSDYVVIQINDTHPSMVIPELIRLLVVHGLTMDEAITQVRHARAYDDRTAWGRKMLVNIARSGQFSSDRTIAEYDRNIWKLK